MLKKLFISTVAAMVIGAPVVHAATHSYKVSSQNTNTKQVTMKVPTVKGYGTAAMNKQIQAFQKAQYQDYKKTFKGSKYASYDFNYKVLTNTKKYLALQLSSTVTAGDSATVSKYYTLNKDTGKQVTLASLYGKGKDYKKIINKAVKKQAKGTSFKSINKETKFYVNKHNKLVLTFDEGEIAPYSEGALSYTVNI